MEKQNRKKVATSGQSRGESIKIGLEKKDGEMKWSELNWMEINLKFF